VNSRKHLDTCGHCVRTVLASPASSMQVHAAWYHKRKDLPDRPEAEQSSQLILPGHSSLILMSGPHDQSPGVCKGEGALLRGVPWVKGRLS